MRKKILIKFGGSIMTPDLPDPIYIKKFCKFVTKFSKDYRFILVVGGGGINSRYNAIAKKIAKVNDVGLDWIGIYASRLNARLLVGVLGEKCHSQIVTNPTADLNWQTDILVGAGWKPGWSTNYVALVLADKLKVTKIITATNTDYIFNKDPNKHSDAKALERISWQELREMIGDEWKPRMHAPLDPSAIRYAQKKKMTVINLNGKNLTNLKKAIKGEDFKGTTVS
ncbi:MAG: UMP kinase [Patescibacteria group bacterium]|nr:UMP kinase [Patescibacteria group bacterium]